MKIIETNQITGRESLFYNTITTQDRLVPGTGQRSAAAAQRAAWRAASGVKLTVTDFGEKYRRK